MRVKFHWTCLLFLLTGFLAILSHDASANQCTIYGQDTNNELSQLSGNVCVISDQGLRLRADVVDQWGRRYGLPVNYFVWRLTRANGRWDQWDARVSRSFGPFEAGDEPHSVYVWIPDDMGKRGWITLGTVNAQTTSLKLIDPAHADNRETCQWAPPGIYMQKDQDPPGDGFPTEPLPIELIECQNVCMVGAYCTDGCPYGADCRFYPANPRPYWQIRSCR